MIGPETSLANDNACWVGETKASKRLERLVKWEMSILPALKVKHHIKHSQIWWWPNKLILVRPHLSKSQFIVVVDVDVVLSWCGADILPKSCQLLKLLAAHQTRVTAHQHWPPYNGQRTCVPRANHTHHLPTVNPNDLLYLCLTEQTSTSSIYQT